MASDTAAFFSALLLVGFVVFTAMPGPHWWRPVARARHLYVRYRGHRAPRTREPHRVDTAIRALARLTARLLVQRKQPRLTLATQTPGRRMVTGQPSRHAITTLIYQPADPYVIALRATTRAGSFTYTIARDLLLAAVTNGAAGEGLIRVHRTATVVTVMVLQDHPATVDPSDQDTREPDTSAWDTSEWGSDTTDDEQDTVEVETLVLLLDPVLDILTRSLALVPQGEEPLDIDRTLTRLLTDTSTR